MDVDWSQLAARRILVVGDVMLDRYLWGEVSRISPEAPVPVVRIRERSETPGGAGNVAVNLAGLKCPVTLLGICGEDDAGTRLKRNLEARGVDLQLIADTTRPTITKTRVMAQGQQLFRLDEEESTVLDPGCASRLLDIFQKRIGGAHAVVLSDYGKGLLQTPEICQEFIHRCRGQHIPVIVDPKGTDWSRYTGATCITPNTAELEAAATRKTSGHETLLIDAARRLRDRVDSEYLLVTRGPHGMILIGPEPTPVIIPARAREVFDVSGAGDTVVATLAAGLTLGMNMSDAARLANLAAGIVVGKLGTQPVMQDELAESLRYQTLDRPNGFISKIVNREAALVRIQSWRTAGNRIVFTNGCYDLLHPGHIHLLHQSRMLGDRLVVGVNTDASVKRLKGDSRPILSERDRASILSALSSVDLVVLFDEDTPLELISMLRPDILVKGDDYRLDQVVGRDMVESYGGTVCLVPLLPGYSTTGIARRILKNGGTPA
jgi:D-beta-D-heptose 7-phosphate kinase/D-beta-D-heptose 1-phosphate adenosyltransferase